MDIDILCEVSVNMNPSQCSASLQAFPVYRVRILASRLAGGSCSTPKNMESEGKTVQYIALEASGLTSGRRETQNRVSWKVFFIKISKC